MNSENPLVVRERVAARLLGVSVAALRRWRRERRGPPFVRLERCIGYPVADLEAFITDNRVEHDPKPRDTMTVMPSGATQPAEESVEGHYEDR